MKIEIKYCAVWNYKPEAAGLAEELRNSLGVESELTPGSNGIFDVIVDGKTVFSKYETGRFPDTDEISSKLK